MAKLLAVLSSFQEPVKGWGYFGITEDEKLKFIRYMLFDSPWKECFLNKSAEDVLEKNSWVLNVEQGGSYLSSAAFATRLISEFPLHFLAWDQFTFLGANPSVAYLLSMHYRFNNEKEGIIKNTLDSHIPFFSSYGPDYFKSFVEGRPVYRGEKYKTNPIYRRVSAVWGEEEGNLSRDLDKIVPRTKTTIKNLDIFYLNKKGGAYLFKEDDEVIGLVEDYVSLMEGK